MYESIGLDAAIAEIDTDDDGKSDHMTCIVYYSGSADSFLEEEKKIMESAGVVSPTSEIRFKYLEAGKSGLLLKYSTGIWIIADPALAEVKDMVGYVTHTPYRLSIMIDVGA
jgi:hypothetical protein